MLDRSEYTVGWICVSSIEFNAAQAFLGRQEKLTELSLSFGTGNRYVLGCIGDHNTVVTVQENESSDTPIYKVEQTLISDFSNIRTVLKVGTGGGAPNSQNDIRLGDIVVGQPQDGTAGVFLFDFDATIQKHCFQGVSFLQRPSLSIEEALKKIKEYYAREPPELDAQVAEVIASSPRFWSDYKRPDTETDRLYYSDLIHNASNAECSIVCSNDHSVLRQRPRRMDSEYKPLIHYGLIASTDKLMEDAFLRDQLSEQTNVLSFKREMIHSAPSLPCLVICGIHSYSDSHRTGDWRPYAAMAATAFTRNLICQIPSWIKAEQPIAKTKLWTKSFTDTRKKVNHEALLAASWRGEIKTVKLLLGSEMDVIPGSVTYGKALERASNNGHLEIVRILLDHGADIQTDKVLSFAVANGHLEIAQICLDYRAPAQLEKVLHSAAQNGNLEIVKILLKYGANARCSRVIESAAAKGHLKIVETLLERGADARSNEALWNAAFNGQLEIVKVLLDYGESAQIDKALHIAVVEGHLEIMKILLGHGVNAQMDEALRFTAENGHLEIVEKLDYRVDIRYTKALYSAAEFGHQEIVEFLLNRGAYTQENDAFETAAFKRPQEAMNTLLTYGEGVEVNEALRLAARNGFIEHVKLLLNHGVNAQEDAFEIAAFKGHQEIVRIFLDHGADANHKCRPLSEPLWALILEIHPEVTEILIDYGATVDLRAIKHYSIIKMAPSRHYLNVVKVLLAHGVFLNPGLKALYKEILDNTKVQSLQEIICGEINRLVYALDMEDHSEVGMCLTWALKNLCMDLSKYLVQEKFLQAISFKNQKTRKQETEAEDRQKSLPNPTIVTPFISNREEHGSVYVFEDKFESVSSEETKGKFDTILWLIKSVPFRNFTYNIFRHTCSSLEHVTQVLQLGAPMNMTCSVIFDFDWELGKFCKTELDEGDTVGNSLTLSGGVDNAEASSCRDYCNRIWPDTGEQLIKIIEELCEGHSDPSSIQTLYSIECSRNKSPEGFGLENFRFKVSGSERIVTCVAQQLAWMGVTFREPKTERFTLSTFYIERTDQPGIFNISLDKLRVVPDMTDQICWHPLFIGGMLAYKFPIKPRGTGKGVEISFEVMTFLAGITYVTEHKNRLILEGFSALIFPVSQISSGSDETSAQWHLICDPGPTPIKRSLLQEYQTANFRLGDFESLSKSRVFLGCFKDIDIHLGSSEIDYDQIRNSSLEGYVPKFALSGVSAGFTLAKFGGLSAVFHFSKPAKSLSLIRSDRSYRDILSYSSSMPLIIYDSGSLQGWMVPTLGVILHMIHIWARRDEGLENPPELPSTKPQWNIGQEARTVIEENGELELFTDDKGQPFKLKDKVTEFWNDLNGAVQKTAKRELPEAVLIGWELLEFVDRKQVSTPKQINKIKGNWSLFSKNPETLVLLCSGLGEVIVPRTDRQTLCNHWKQVPKQQDYLTASVRCIHQLNGSPPGSNFDFKLGDNLYWKPTSEEQIFSDCLLENHVPCQWAQSLEKGCYRPKSEVKLEERGAVVFGRSRPRTYPQRRLQKAKTEKSTDKGSGKENGVRGSCVQEGVTS